MFYAVIFATVIAVILIAFGALCSISDWAGKEGRTFCLIRWYRRWSLKKGGRNAALTKMRVRIERRKSNG
jgi:hypothetical protein